MTDREKAIVMAYTGACMLTGEKFGVFHAYIEDIMGRPIYTHELAIQSICDEIKEKSRDDYIKLCREEQEPCEMTAKEYRQRMIQAFHNADADGLIAVCVLPTEKEFKHLEWLLKNHYKKETCEDEI